MLSCAMMPLVASRLAFPEVAGDWDLGEYLHGDMKTAYEDPSTNRVPDPPALPQGKICGGKQEFTKFAQRADQVAAEQSHLRQKISPGTLGGCLGSF